MLFFFIVCFFFNAGAAFFACDEADLLEAPPSAAMPDCCCSKLLHREQPCINSDVVDCRMLIVCAITDQALEGVGLKLKLPSLVSCPSPHLPRHRIAARMEELQDESQEQHEAIQEFTAYNDVRKAMQEGKLKLYGRDLGQPLVYAFQEKDASSYPELYGYGEPTYGGLKRSGDSLYDEERPFKVLNTAASSNDAGTSRGQTHLDASSSNQSSSSIHPTAAWHQYASHTAPAYPPVPPRHLAYPTPQTVFMGSPGIEQFPSTSTPQGWQQNVFARK